MTITQSQIDQLLTRVRQTYPGWQNFNHAPFVAEQIDAQQTAAGLMRTHLARPEFERLLRQNLYAEISTRLEQVARATTLLDLTESASGDLHILTAATVNQGELCRQLFNLLYGNAAIETRLQHYLAFVSKQANSLNRWAFPTYFLFLVHPDREMFVNPALTERYLTWFGVADGWSPQPTVAAYVDLVAFVQQLQRALQPYAPHDLIDLQGLLQVAFSQPQQPLLTAEKRAEFATLFQQFLATYPQTDEGRYHIANYQANRLEAERNYAAIVAAHEQGEDVTDRVLLQLLPYANNSRNRASGAWLHLAPTINGDLRKWYEASGWTKPADWPAVATAILDFITQCITDPAALSTACAAFTALPYSKGFQSGQLTPILNALRPAAFVLINNKSRQVLNYFTGEQFESTLHDYPAANAALQQLHRELAEQLAVPALNLSPGDTFDMFCHWLVAVYKFSFKELHYWKIAPGENAWQWQECLEGNFIAIGWDELGDLTTMSQSDFNTKRDALLAQNPAWGRAGVNQVWDFAKKIREGDRIVANRGTTEVLGIGAVTGPYYFVPNVRYGHRLPVEWDDTTLRKVNQGGWRKTIIPLDRATFEEVTTPPQPPLPAPYTDDNFLQETYLHPDRLTDLLDLLADKRQLILYGPPGTGKTFIAQRLARLLTGLAQPGPRVQTIQFHPAYGYEDFIEGIRPESKLTPTGQQVVEYPVVAGRFREFCERTARHDPAVAHVFIIDEINRGNLPRIFGELLYLLEYRGESITLPYSGKAFQIPPNVYLIGTMNTADRSIALVDFALRRRFNFVPLPADPDLFDRWLAAHPLPIPYLGALYRRLCKEAIEDSNYQIGPSYFMQPALTEPKLANIWRYSIEPLLQEYYAENPKNAAVWAWGGELLQSLRNG